MTRVIAFGLLLFASPALAGGRVAGSKHDFSATGPGPYRAVSERSPCIFCHVSHGAGPWRLTNRPDPAGGHVPYQSSTMSGRASAPSGASRICLSCHDGTIAVGQTRNGEIRMAMGDSRIRPDRKAYLGTDLRGSHPVSLLVTPSGRVHEPSPGDAVRLDRDRQVQCTSCHDPHDEWGDPVKGMFLVKASARSALCLSCHSVPAGATAAATHLTSPAQYRDRATGAVRTLAEEGCEVCHVQHGADKRGRLLATDAPGDALCLSCHSGATQKTVSTDVQKPYAHPPDTALRHDASEGPNAGGLHALPERSPGAPRHVACVDCHDPHASNPTSALGNDVGGALAGVSGIDVDGQPVNPARHEYEVCFKCHGDSANKPKVFGTLGAIRRAADDDDLRLVFGPGAASSHPVAAPSRTLAPSVLSPPPGRTIRCTDCHASDQGPAAGGIGARGPHGSSYPALLERRYRTDDLTPEGPDAYALCYKCHDRDTLLSSRSTFPFHRKHVVEQSTPCSVCHDPHGVSARMGNDRNNAHLVSFDLAVVRAGASGTLQYAAQGMGHGSCTLTCHNVVHGPPAPSDPAKKPFSY